MQCRRLISFGTPMSGGLGPRGGQVLEDPSRAAPWLWQRKEGISGKGEYRGSPFVVSLSRTRKVPRGFSGLSSSRSDSRRVIFPKYHLWEQAAGSQSLSRAPLSTLTPKASQNMGGSRSPSSRAFVTVGSCVTSAFHTQWSLCVTGVLICKCRVCSFPVPGGEATQPCKHTELRVPRGEAEKRLAGLETKQNGKNKQKNKTRQMSFRFCTGGEGQQRGKRCSANAFVIVCFKTV